MGLANPGRALGRSSLLLISPKLLTVWHPAINSFRLAFLLALLVGLNLSFLSDKRACVVYQNHKSHSFRVLQEVTQGSIFGPVLFSVFINNLPAFLPSSVSWSLYAVDLAILSSVPTAVETSQGALFQWEHWSEYWCLPLNLVKGEASFFSVDPHLLLLGSRLRFNPTLTFLGVTFDCTLYFFNMCIR